MKTRIITRGALFALALAAITALVGASGLWARIGYAKPRAGLFFVDYRDLNGGADGVALLDLDPESKQFGRMLQQAPIGAGVTPHHLYFNAAEERLYTTALGGEFLYEVKLKPGRGVPRIQEIVPIATGGSQVGEDMYFTKDGSRFYTTFMAGKGGPRGGTVGVFDAQTNQLIETIEAPRSADPTATTPFIMYPHGISANEELGKLMVTSQANPAAPADAGNTITTIDLATNDVLRTQLAAESPADLSSTVEVLMLRDGLPPFALTTTVNGGDIWVAPYDASAGTFGDFQKQFDGSDHGLGVALEFYVHANHHGEKELYVSFAAPGVVNVYSLDQLPALPLKRTITTGAGAHHMAFFESRSGRELIVVQNNLINIDGLNAGTLTIHDAHTGELVRTLDMRAAYGALPESIESAFGHGADLHH